jgi:hypothetical protein
MIKGKGNTMGTQGNVDDKTCLYWLGLKIRNKSCQQKLFFRKEGGQNGLRINKK